MDDEPRAIEHDAPPPYRPLSGMAVTALVIAVVSFFIAPGGPWWIVVAPLVLAAFSWGAIAQRRKRGAGVAIAAAVVSLGIGGLAFFTQRMADRQLEGGFDRLLSALARGDRAEIDRWIADGEDKDAVAARWKSRLEAAERESGAYVTVTIDALWLGPYVEVLLPPQDVIDVENAGATAPAPGSALWFEAVFRRRSLRAAAVVAKETDPKVIQAAITDLVSDKPARLHDLRFFREK